MATAAFLLSIPVSALGALGLVSPRRLADFARGFLWSGGLYLAAVIRIVFGAVFVLAAPHSRFPEIVRVVGLLSILAGLLTPILGVDRQRRMLDWWTARGSLFMRIWS